MAEKKRAQALFVLIEFCGLKSCSTSALVAPLFVWRLGWHPSLRQRFEQNQIVFVHHFRLGFIAYEFSQFCCGFGAE